MPLLGVIWTCDGLRSINFKKKKEYSSESDVLRRYNNNNDLNVSPQTSAGLVQVQLVLPIQLPKRTWQELRIYTEISEFVAVQYVL